MRRPLRLAVALLVGVPTNARFAGWAAEDPSTGSEHVAAGSAEPEPVVGHWRVRTTVTVGAATDDVRLTLLVPSSDGRQDILVRRLSAPGFRVRDVTTGPNAALELTASAGPRRTVTYEIGARITDASLRLPSTPVGALSVPPEVRPFLAVDAGVAAVAAARAHEVLGAIGAWDATVWSAFQHVATFAGPDGGNVPQDAAAVLSARRGTMLGRARALVALLRVAGVPARIVGGLPLTAGAARRATISWVEAWSGAAWVPLDPTTGRLGRLAENQLTLYHDDAPLMVHTRGVPVDYAIAVRSTAPGALETSPDWEEGSGEPDLPPQGVVAHRSHVRAPVGTVVLMADQSVPDTVVEQILQEARNAEIDCTLLTASVESRFFRTRQLERLVTANLTLLRGADVVLVATADDAGAYALLALGEHGVRLPDARLLVAGSMGAAPAAMLGGILQRLVGPGEVAIVRRPTDLLTLWAIVRANLLDGVPMREEAERWGVDALVLGDVAAPPTVWRLALIETWARVVRAQIPLPALTLILVLPLIATLVVIGRVVVGITTFGTFGPVIVALAFVTTGLLWGTVTFVLIVGLGIALRGALQRLRLQAVARLAILVALVAVVMAGLTLVGAALGIGPLLHLSVFPMLIMANVVETFGAAQVEEGTRRALRTTLNTLGLAIACYLVVDRAGLQSLVLCYPELLVFVVGLDVLLGKWRGMRLLEFARFGRSLE